MLGYYYACAVTCRYKTPVHLLQSNTSTIEDIFEQSLARTILEHPLLQVGLANENSKKPYWVQLESIDLKNHVEWQTVANAEEAEHTLRDTLQAQHDRSFVNLDRQPLWRLVILKKADGDSLDATFVWNHTAADGMSGKIFHRHLLKNLNLVSSGQSNVELGNRVLKLSSPMSLTPPLENVLKFSVSPGFLALEGWKALRPPFLASKSPHLANWAPIRPTPYGTQIQLLQIEDDVVQTLLQTCRRHEATLTGLLHSLVLLSFTKRLTPAQAAAFDTGTPIDLRRFITSSPPGRPELVPHETIGNIVTYFSHKFDVGVVANIRRELEGGKSNSSKAENLENILWSAAAQFKKRIAEKLQAGTKNDTIGLLKLVGDWRSYLKSEIKKDRNISWEVSNLGVLEGRPQASDDHVNGEDGWEIDRAVFSQSATVVGPAFILSPISVKGKSLTITCAWQHDVVETALATGVASDLKTWLNDLGSGRPLSIGEAN